MKPLHPPRLAVWLLKHFGPETNLEALTGDLQEGFSQGKSAAWYWRQVLAAIHWRRHLGMFLIPVGFGWLMTWWVGGDLWFVRLLCIAIVTISFLAVRYLPEIVGGKLGLWLSLVLGIFFLLLFYPGSVPLLLISVLDRRTRPSRPDRGTEEQKLIESLHLSLLHETDPKLRTTYEQAITTLKGQQKRN